MSQQQQASRKVVAVDIGTTSTKVLLLDEVGHVLAAHNGGYALHTPAPGIAEQDPEAIWAQVVEGIRQVVRGSGTSAAEISCVSFSAAMHSLILLDEAHKPLLPMLTWADARSETAAEQLKASGQGLALYQRTGTPIHPMSPLVKLIWLQAHEPELMRRTARCVGIKEYVCYKLFGQYIVDISIASATGLMNLDTLAWDEEALAVAGVRESQLSQLVPTTYTLTGLSVAQAEMLGLSVTTPFVIGASDGVLANLGGGVMDASRMAVSIGTSSAVRTVVERPVRDPQGRLFCYALTGQHWVIGGASNNGAIVLQWAIQQLFSEEEAQLQAQGKEPYSELLKLAEPVQAGAEGLLFLPLLAGERAPFWQGEARGVYFGLSLAHGKVHMLRAALEGVVSQVAVIQRLLAALSGGGTTLVASGGFARSAMWCQLLADVTGSEVLIPESVDSSALGAARLGLYAIGALEELTPFPEQGTAQRYMPNEARHAFYRKQLALYETVYAQLAPSFHKLARLQEDAVSMTLQEARS